MGTRLSGSTFRQGVGEAGCDAHPHTLLHHACMSCLESSHACTPAAAWESRPTSRSASSCSPTGAVRAGHGHPAEHARPAAAWGGVACSSCCCGNGANGSGPLCSRCLGCRACRARGQAQGHHPRGRRSDYGDHQALHHGAACHLHACSYAPVRQAVYQHDHAQVTGGVARPGQ